MLDVKIDNLFENVLLNRTEILGHVISKKPPTNNELTTYLTDSFGIKHIIISNNKTKFGSQMTTFQARMYKDEDTVKKIEKFHILHKYFGAEKTKLPRRTRKDIRKKKYKVWGTEKRNMKKEANKQKR